MTLVRFKHGLGDAVYFSLILRLYALRGIPITVGISDDKKCLIRAAGQTCWEGPYGNEMLKHPWEYPSVNLHSGHGRLLLGNKIGWQVSNPPLPYLGDAEALWDDLVATRFSLETEVSTDQRDAVSRWFDKMARPIILYHSRGNTNAGTKSITDEQSLTLYEAVAQRSGGTLVVLDWVNQCPPGDGVHQRHLSEFGNCDVPTLWEMIRQADLMVGCDSGPLHLARLTKTKTIGFWQNRHYPARYTLPRLEQLNVTLSDYGDRWHKWKRIPYTIVQHEGTVHDPQRLAVRVEQMLGPPRFLAPSQIAADIQLQDFVEHMRGKPVEVGEPYAYRNLGFARALEIAGRRFQGPMIVETGSMASEECWHTTGMSTYVLGCFAMHRDGNLVTIDRSPEAYTCAYEWTRCFGDTVVCVQGDAEQELKRFGLTGIDLLYLDGGDPLLEWAAALPALSPNALVLINDVYRHGLDFRRIATGAGWHVLHEGTQLLVSRVPEVA